MYFHFPKISRYLEFIGLLIVFAQPYAYNFAVLIEQFFNLILKLEHGSHWIFGSFID